MEWLAAWILTGAAAGLLAGLMGVGGGLVMVPALLFLFQLQGVDEAHRAHLAVGSSLAAIVPISVASLWAHHRRGAVEWRRVARLAPGLMAGAWSGAWLADRLSTGWLQALFGLFLLAVSVQMAHGAKIRPAREARVGLPGADGLAGTLIGLVSGLVGIGGGTMTVPYLVWRGRPMPRAVATSAACGLPIALAGAAGFVHYGRDAGLEGALGHVHWPAVAAMAPAAVLLAPLGARLAHSLPVPRLRRLFALVLLAVAARLLLTSPGG